MKMRVLFLSRHLGPAGTTTHLAALARGLKQAGCSVAVASQQHSKYELEMVAWFETNGIRCYGINFPTPYRTWSDNASRLLSSGAELIRIVGEFEPDIVHVQWRSVSPYAQLLKLYRRIPFVTTLNIESIPCSRLYRLVSFWGNHAIAISQETHKDLLEKFRIPSRKLQIIHYGCDSEHLRPPSLVERNDARRSFGLSQNEYVASMVARISPEKRHEIAIRALASLRSKGKDLHLLIAGASFSHEVTPRSLTKLASDLGVSDLVHLLGHTDTRTVLWASDLTVLPSAYEGLPMAIIEAMLCGIVPIRTPAAGAGEQIEDGISGFLFPFEDHIALADRIDQLLSSPCLREKMAGAALRTAREKFSLQNMVDKTLRVYESVLTH
jgi:glycosyltransferase involved in cell wall biosynthesis